MVDYGDYNTLKFNEEKEGNARGALTLVNQKVKIRT